MPLSDRDFEAEMDMETMVRAKEIERDPGRVRRAREKALERAEHFRSMADALPGRGGFVNGAVKGSGMKPRG